MEHLKKHSSYEYNDNYKHNNYYKYNSNFYDFLDTDKDYAHSTNARRTAK